jgi:hypothetical protein
MVIDSAGVGDAGDAKFVLRMQNASRREEKTADGPERKEEEAKKKKKPGGEENSVSFWIGCKNCILGWNEVKALKRRRLRRKGTTTNRHST